MRFTARLLLAVVLFLPLANAIAASRMPSGCCCKAMKDHCPLKKQRRSCAQNCSMRGGEADVARWLLPNELRDGASQAETSFRLAARFDGHRMTFADAAVPRSRNVPPELQPPKQA